MGGRGVNHGDRFETDMNAILGDRMRRSDDLCGRVWGSLADCDRLHENGDTASYSFRAAGDLIAAIIGRGDYLDWCCCVPERIPDAEVLQAMSQRGWKVREVST